MSTEDQLQSLCEAQRAEIKRLGEVNAQLLAALEDAMRLTCMTHAPEWFADKARAAIHKAKRE